MRLQSTLFIALFQATVALCQGVSCDLNEYKPLEGLKAEVVADELQVTWQGERNQQLRAVFAVKNQQPLVRELGVRSGAGGWRVLLVPA